MLLSAFADLIGSHDIFGFIVAIVISAFLVFICIPIHELAHAFVAYKLGDKSIKYKGRLTFNPLAHIDPLGAAMIALIGFGWGKPCPIDSSRFKKPKRDLAFVAAAGPCANLLLGWLFIFIYNLLYAVAPGFMAMTIGKYFVGSFLINTGYISIYLGVLNLLPIPMFDGFTILSAFLKPKTEFMIMENQQAISVIIIILLFSGILTTPIQWIASFLISAFAWLSALPFSLL